MEEQQIIEEFKLFLKDKSYPCVAAKAALDREQLDFFVAEHMACPSDDKKILQFLYNFIDVYRTAEKFYHTAIIIFKGPEIYNEDMFENLMWQRLQALSDLDSEKYHDDKRVASDPNDPHYSYSIKEEAFFINGMHPASGRRSRQFKFPCLVMNPHQQFVKLKEMNKYFKMRKSIRVKDEAYCGSENVMARDFYFDPETFQYSGRIYNRDWKCPLKKRMQ